MRDNTTSFASFQFARGGQGDARPSGRRSATNSLEFAPFRRFFCWTLSLVRATLVFQAVAPSRAQENQGPQALISRNRGGNAKSLEVASRAAFRPGSHNGSSSTWHRKPAHRLVNHKTPGPQGQRLAQGARKHFLGILSPGRRGAKSARQGNGIPGVGTIPAILRIS